MRQSALVTQSGHAIVHERSTKMNGLRLLTSLTVAGLLATSAVAAPSGPSHTTGQPNQSCEDNPTTPGNASSAPGSAFNPNGNAGTHYAGEQPQNSKNSASVSQYDVACTK